MCTLPYRKPNVFLLVLVLCSCISPKIADSSVHFRHSTSVRSRLEQLVYGIPGMCDVPFAPKPIKVALNETELCTTAEHSVPSAVLSRAAMPVSACSYRGSDSFQIQCMFNDLISPDSLFTVLFKPTRLGAHLGTVHLSTTLGLFTFELSAHAIPNKYDLVPLTLRNTQTYKDNFLLAVVNPFSYPIQVQAFPGQGLGITFTGTVLVKPGRKQSVGNVSCQEPYQSRSEIRLVVNSETLNILVTAEWINGPTQIQEPPPILITFPRTQLEVPFALTLVSDGLPQEVSVLIGSSVLKPIKQTRRSQELVVGTKEYTIEEEGVVTEKLSIAHTENTAVQEVFALFDYLYFDSVATFISRASVGRRVYLVNNSTHPVWILSVDSLSLLIRAEGVSSTPVQPNTSAYAFTVTVSSLQDLSSSVMVKTNIGTLVYPVLTEHSVLEVITHEDHDTVLPTMSIGFGYKALLEPLSKVFSVRPAGNFEVTIRQINALNGATLWAVPAEDCARECVPLAQHNPEFTLLPNETATFLVKAAVKQGLHPTIVFKTDTQDCTLSLGYRLARGNMTIVPVEFVQAYPGLRVNQTLQIHNFFNIPVELDAVNVDTDWISVELVNTKLQPKSITSVAILSLEMPVTEAKTLQNGAQRMSGWKFPEESPFNLTSYITVQTTVVEKLTGSLTIQVQKPSLLLTHQVKYEDAALNAPYSHYIEIENPSIFPVEFQLLVVCESDFESDLNNQLKKEDQRTIRKLTPPPPRRQLRKPPNFLEVLTAPLLPSIAETVDLFTRVPFYLDNSVPLILPPLKKSSLGPLVFQTAHYGEFSAHVLVWNNLTGFENLELLAWATRPLLIFSTFDDELAPLKQISIAITPLELLAFDCALGPYSCFGVPEFSRRFLLQNPNANPICLTSLHLENSFEGSLQLMPSGGPFLLPAFSSISVDLTFGLRANETAFLHITTEFDHSILPITIELPDVTCTACKYNQHFSLVWIAAYLCVLGITTAGLLLLICLSVKFIRSSQRRGILSSYEVTELKIRQNLPGHYETPVLDPEEAQRITKSAESTKRKKSVGSARHRKRQRGKATVQASANAADSAVPETDAVVRTHDPVAQETIEVLKPEEDSEDSNDFFIDNYKQSNALFNYYWNEEWAGQDELKLDTEPAGHTPD